MLLLAFAFLFGGAMSDAAPVWLVALALVEITCELGYGITALYNRRWETGPSEELTSRQQIRRAARQEAAAQLRGAPKLRATRRAAAQGIARSVHAAQSQNRGGQ